MNQSSALYYAQPDNEESREDILAEKAVSASEPLSVPATAAALQQRHRNTILSLLLMPACFVIPILHHFFYAHLDGHSVSWFVVGQQSVRNIGNAMAFAAGTIMMAVVGQAWERRIWLDASSKYMTMRQLNAVFQSLNTKLVWLQPHLLRRAKMATALAFVSFAKNVNVSTHQSIRSRQRFRF